MHRPNTAACAAASPKVPPALSAIGVTLCCAVLLVAGCEGTLNGGTGDETDGRVDLAGWHEDARMADAAVRDHDAADTGGHDAALDQSIADGSPEGGSADGGPEDGGKPDGSPPDGPAADAPADAGWDADNDAGVDSGDGADAGADAADSGGPPSRPNILFIAIDDLNDWVGVLGGHPQAKTPRIDGLAAQGLLFTNAHTAAPVCNPARVATLTGIRPSTSGVYKNVQPWRPVMPDAVTLPDHFRRHGYKTLGAGKILHENNILHGTYLDPGAWDEYYPAKCQQRDVDPVPPGRPVNGIPDTGAFDWGPVEVADSAMADHKVAEWVANQLAVPHAEPFFLACGFFRPHLSWYVPPAYFAGHPLSGVQLPLVKADDIDDLPPSGQSTAIGKGYHADVVAYDQWHAAVQGYLAALNFADAMVGRVLDALQAGPHAGNTIVVLWTDHGWHLGEKEHWGKSALWEEATRVPVIVKAPGVTTVNTTTARPVSLIDLYPTLIELAGLPERPELEGRSLVPLLSDPNDASARWREPVLTTSGRKNHALRDQRWRYIRYRNGDEELYDHEVDPMEWVNLIPKLSSHATARHARDRLAAWLEANVTDAPHAPTEDDYPLEELECKEGD